MRKISYNKFIKQYPKRYKTALFYPNFLRLKDKGFDFSQIRQILKSNVPESTLYFWFKGYIPLPFKEFCKIKIKFSNEDINLLSNLIGHIFGDGGITKNKFLNYCNTEEFLINEFKSIMKKVFNAEPTTFYKEPSGIIRLTYSRFFSRILLCLFGNFSLGKNTKRITTQINNMPLKWKIGLLQAWYNDDGSVPISKKYRCIAFKQKDKNLILWIQKTLKELKIDSKLSKDEDKWHLRISNYLNMIKFRDKVGFSENYRKQLRLNELLKKIKSPHWKTKLKILDLLKEKSKTIKELNTVLKLDPTVIWSHMSGSRNKLRKNTVGLINLGLVNIKKHKNINIYSLNKRRYNLIKKDLNI